MSKEQSNFYLGENVSNTAKRPFAAVTVCVRRASGIVQTGEVIGEHFEARFYVGRTGVAVLVNWGSLLQSAIAAQRRHDDPQEREPAITSPSPPTKTSRKGRYPTPSTVTGCVIRELYVRGQCRAPARERPRGAFWSTPMSALSSTLTVRYSPRRNGMSPRS